MYLRQIDIVIHVGCSGDASPASNAPGKGAHGLPLAVLLGLVVQQVPVEGVLVHCQVPPQIGKDAIQGFVLHTFCAQLVPLQTQNRQ